MDPLEYENLALRDHIKLLSNAYCFERTMRNMDPDEELMRATRRILGSKVEAVAQQSADPSASQSNNLAT